MLNSIDLFSGIGGLSWGLSEAGFKVIASIEIDAYAVKGYKLNHPKTKIISQDIKLIDPKEIRNLLNGEPLHLLAGCPPCQGFSTVRKLNKKQSVRDKRNQLILEYLRFVIELEPLTIMFENVPGVKDYYLFKQMVRELQNLTTIPNMTLLM